MAETGQEAIGAGLGEGLDTIASQLRYNRAQASSERDREADRLADQMKSIADNIIRVGGKDKPEAAPLVQALEETVRKHNALYPSHEAPALIQRLKGLIGKHSNIPVRPDARASATAEGSIAAAARPGYNTTDEYLRHQNDLQGEFTGKNYEVQQSILDKSNAASMQYLKDHGGTEEDLKALAAIHAGIPASLMKPAPEKSQNYDTITGHLADGTPFSYQRSKFSGKAVTMAGEPLDPSMLQGFVIDPKSAVKNKQGWIIDPKTGKPLSIMLDANNHVVPGTENYDAVPPPSLFGRMTTTNVILDDGFGNFREFPKTTITGPVGGSSSAPPATATGPASGTPVASSAPRAAELPQSPAEARAQLPPPGGRVIGAKASKPYQAAKEDYDKAQGIVSLAKAAATKKSALSDRNLAIRMAREASGRFSMAEYDTMIKNAGLGNTFEQWMNNLSGGQLPDNIRNQLISVANDNLAAAKASLEAAGGGPAKPPSGGPASDRDPLGLGF